jgi:hypothetical protein
VQFKSKKLISFTELLSTKVIIMKKLLLIVLLSMPSFLFSQTLVETVNLPSGAVWNQAYGLVYANGKYWVTSGSTDAKKKIYGINASGVLTDEITINYYTMSYSQGLAHDGTNFWYVERKTSKCDLYKVTPTGTVLDSISFSAMPGGGVWYLGGAAWDDSTIWVSVYYPDASVAAYQVNPNTKRIIDTIMLPPGQLQPTGITIKGDTLFIANDNFSTTPPLQGLDKIHAYNKRTKQLLYSFSLPERPDQKQSPRGLAWDGSHFWLIAEPVNATSGRQLFKYDLAGNGTPGLYLLNSSLSYGNVQIDSSSIKHISINNYGTADLIIDSVAVSNNVYQVLSSFPLHIAANSTKELQVKFTPVSNLVYNDSVKLYHNFKALPPSKIVVSGKGVFTSSYIAFTPANLTFGDKRKNSTSYIELTIRNYGSVNIIVDSVSSGSSNFYFEHFSGPVTIDTLNPATFRVWFNPDEYTPFSTDIKVYSNAANGAVKDIPASGTGTAFDPLIGNILWQAEVPPNPITSYQDYSVEMIKQIPDINGDGIDDIIISTDNYWVIAYNGNSSNSADILWKFSTYINNNNAGSVEMVQNMQFADVNRDGIMDVIIGTWGGNESVYALNGRSGQIIWEFGLPTSYDGDIMGIDAKRDWNGDGIPDILASASGNESTGEGRYSVYLLNGADGTQIWRIDQSAQKKLKYDVTSTSNGGAFGTRVGTVYEVVGFDRAGNITWTFPTTAAPYRLGEIEDIGGDINTDIIVGTINGMVYALSSDAGVQIWSRSIGSGAFIEDLRVVRDMNGNNVQDILISGISPTIFLLDGAAGQTIWSMPVAGNILGISPLPDMTGDGMPEMGTSDLGCKLFIFNGVNGTPLWEYSFGTGNNYAAEMISAMGEVDGIGVGEFIAGSRHGKLIAFSGGREGVVPVEMTSFSAAVNGNKVTLNWKTSTELNNKGFYIERKSSNGTFENIGFIDGKGTSTEPSSYSFIDSDLPYGTYYYRLNQMDFDGTNSYSNEVLAEVGLPIEYSLLQNYPNPFNPSTTIKYAIPFEGKVMLKIYNSVGEEVAVLVNTVQNPGNYQIDWNGRNNQNMLVPSGVYIYRIETENFTSSKKMLMLK